MARTVRAMWWGRKRRIELLHRMGLKAPGGRLRGPARLRTLQQEALAALRALLAQIEEQRRLVSVNKDVDPGLHS